jgi:N-acyl-D-amino-acid deacylase
MKSFLLFFFGVSFLGHGQSYDLLLKGGKIVDGTGNSWYYGDVAIRDGQIVAIGKLDDAHAKRMIDANGLVVAPGFIDVHTHIEGNEVKEPTAGNFIYDGVTSVVTGNCGSSNLDLARYFHSLDSVTLSINVASLIGHNTVRRAVLGDAARTPTAEEQAKMEALVEQGMKDGALGFSTGLIYVPGTYSRTEEVIGLARAASRYHGVYASHIRDEGDFVNDAIEEAINIGRQAHMPVEISHFKVTYKPNWGKSVGTIAQVEQARADGIDVTIDQYPYIASSTSLSTLLPSWAFSGGRDSLLIRINDPAMGTKIRMQMHETLKKKQLKNYSYAKVASFPADTAFNGKTISQINVMKRRKPREGQEIETILDMMRQGGATMIYFSMNEDDLQRILRVPYNMAASDAIVVPFGQGVPHPRAYGTNARILGRYVRELRVFPLEEAVRRMSSLPAQKFQLTDRGLLRPGMAADVVLFDERTVADRATFEKPHAYATGFRYVIVNGQVVIDEGKHTGIRSGRVLKGPGGK